MYTDHSACLSLLNTPHPSGKLARWALTIHEINLTLKHRSGRQNANADALSRNPQLITLNQVNVFSRVLASCPIEPGQCVLKSCPIEPGQRLLAPCPIEPGQRVLKSDPNESGSHESTFGDSSQVSCCNSVQNSVFSVVASVAESDDCSCESVLPNDVCV